MAYRILIKKIVFIMNQ